MASQGKFLPPQQPLDPKSVHSAGARNAFCGCCSTAEKLEYLDYDYTYDDTTNSKRKPQPYPRIRERGEYYIDSFNDQPWACTFGTGEHVSSSCSSVVVAMLAGQLIN